ncbi:hypothetical protein [Actinokineospora pegani]|uniref:hypothetical protein n=1 Tax=Actinokineospora pegani TaxID=2654637 RepID=UPI001F41AB9A|nr:hypothetical protein [Actinokineospora pegani]
MAEAAETSDWTAPDLAVFATGAALNTLTTSLQTDFDRGVVTTGRPVLEPRVTSAEPQNDPQLARISDCGQSDEWIKVHRDTRQPVDANPGGRRRIAAVVEVQPDGRWRVSDFAVQAIGSC